jgi:hypothetical protein
MAGTQGETGTRLTAAHWLDHEDGEVIETVGDPLYRSRMWWGIRPNRRAMLFQGFNLGVEIDEG